MVAARYEELHGLLVREMAELPDILTMRTYPNPFNSSVTIKLNIPHAETAELAIFDINGRILTSHNFTCGKNEFTWTPSQDTPSGTYLVILRNDTGVISQKLLLVR